MFLFVSAAVNYLISRYQNSIFYLLIWATLISCSHISSDAVQIRSANPETTSDIVEFANKIVLLIRDRKLDELAKYVHPAKELSFSPYGYVSDDYITIKGEELPKIWKSNPVMTWGSYDGSGEPIKISIADYFKTFVYAADYTTAPLIAVNDRLGQGNSYSNIQEVFPDATFVEYHFKGFDPRFQGMDWRSLILVFEKQKNKGWWLIAIVNDQWTI